MIFSVIYTISISKYIFPRRPNMCIRIFLYMYIYIHIYLLARGYYDFGRLEAYEHREIHLVAAKSRWVSTALLSTDTPPKTNKDTQNDGFEQVTSFKNCKSWYLC